MTGKVPAGENTPKSEAKAERDERLAKALRDNLAKRKAQFRARRDEPLDKKEPS